MPEVVRFLRQPGIFFRAEYDLGKPFAVAQIDEDHAAVIAANMNPAGKGGGLSDVALAQFVAMMGPVHARSLWANPPYAQACSLSGERGLPARSHRQLADDILRSSLARRTETPASCRLLQAGSLRSPELSQML